MGQQIFEVDGAFTVPDGITAISICVVGAGGSGGVMISGGAFLSQAGGGSAGEVLTHENLPVTEGTVYGVTIGAGGAPVSHSSQGTTGNPGEHSVFDVYDADGGVPGNSAWDGSPTCVFLGNGQTVTNPCGASSQNGNQAVGDYDSYGYGGQSSGYGLGGNGATAEDGHSATGSPGVHGSGGGGAHIQGADSSTATSGAGGAGYVVVSWDDPPSGKPEFRMNGGIIPEDTGLVRFYGPDLDPVTYPNGYAEVNSVVQHITGDPDDLGHMVWFKTHDAPEKIDDFTATTDEAGQITMDWTPLAYSGAVTYALWSGTSELMGNIEPPYVYIVSAGTAEYFISAVNISGRTDSDPATGTSV